MGLGWPLRIVRALLPTMDELIPKEHPEQDVGGGDFNLDWWQLAGANLVIPRAVLAAKYNTGTSAFVKSYQEEAWNVNSALAHPTLARAGAGEYSYTFAATYPDKDGNLVATVLGEPDVRATKVLAVYADRVDAYAWIDAGDPLVIQVRLFNAAGAGVDDVPFLLKVM